MSNTLSNSSPLDLILNLCQVLAEENINYCHWKSNNALDRSANGENDLDLLVARDDAERFGEILHRLGFKLALAPADRAMPGVLDYYGFDHTGDKIVHVHLHYQLMVGHDLTKNVHLPIERPYLESSTQESLFKVPAPEFELIVLIIRLVLKHLTWDTMLLRNGKLNKAERKELTYLTERVDQSRINILLAHHLPSIPKNLFDQCLAALSPDASLWTQVQAGTRLLKALKAHARRGRLLDVGLKVYRRIYWGIQRRVIKKSPKRFLSNGGAMIVVVGGDGAGKTTAINGLYDWLKNDLEVSRIHLGKPAWSLTTRIVRALLSIGRRLGFYAFISEADILYTNQPPKKLTFAHYVLLLRQVLRSRDRRLTYTRARREAINGRLVICDRFPLPQTALMDGPIIRKLVNPTDMNSVVTTMIRWEEANFQSFSQPEILIVLKLNPQIAAERKIDEDFDYVKARSELVWNADWAESGAHVVDASSAKEVVLNTLKNIIWAAV